MKFLRLAQIELPQLSDESWTKGLTLDNVTLHAQRLDATEDARLRLLVFAEVPLHTRPAVDTDGMIVIDDDLVRRSETVIEAFANLAAIVTCGTRTITSPVPAAGFSDVNDADRQWLDSHKGLSLSEHQAQYVRPLLEISGPEIARLDEDRMDGVALLAEALTQTHETGRFRELIRFFERAFTTSGCRLDAPLSQFLAHFDRLDYMIKEVATWRKLRNHATHADRPQEKYTLARDVRPHMSRVEFAAYDVLFNKLNWQCDDTERRDSWKPAGGVRRDGTSVALVTFQKTLLAPVILDGFGAYPHDFKCRISACPDGWWLDVKHRISRPTKVETFASLRTGLA